MHDDASFGTGYSSIDDAEADATALLDYLDGVAEIPAVRAAKRAASVALALRPGQSVLDVGCGTGVDLLDLAAQVLPGGAVFGLDPSVRALRVARGRVAGSVELVLGAVEQLPFGDGVLDACRADRTLQHVGEPERALHELRRVLRPGGRVVILEMLSYLRGGTTDDQLASFLTRRLWSRKDEAWLPYMLPLLLSRSGFDGVAVSRTDAVSSSLAEADVALRLRVSLEDAVVGGVVDRGRAEAWLAGLGAAEQRGAFALQLQFTCISAVAA